MNKNTVFELSFPKPYKDELVYSIMARYHRRTGNLRQTTTFSEMLGVTSMGHSPFLLSLLNCKILTGETFNQAEFEKKLYRHTLDPFVLRFISPKRKMEILNDILSGKNVQNRPGVVARYGDVKPMLRYCPLCKAEDIEQYGETYWHTEHQIQAMPICLKHQCQLQKATDFVKKVAYHLICADDTTCPNVEPDFSYTQGEIIYSRYLKAALDSSFSFSQQISIDPLQQALEYMGYIGASEGKKQFAVRGLYDELCGMFGKIIVKECFSRKNIQINMNRMIRAKTFTVTEPYMLVAAFVNLPIEKFFVTEPNLTSDMNDGQSTGNYMADRLLEMKKTNFLWSRALIAQKLGIKPVEVDKICEKYNIESFWIKNKNGKGKHVVPQQSIKVFMTDEDKSKVLRRASELDMSVSAYGRYCIQKDIEL